MNEVTYLAGSMHGAGSEALRFPLYDDESPSLRNTKNTVGVMNMILAAACDTEDKLTFGKSLDFVGGRDRGRRIPVYHSRWPGLEPIWDDSDSL